MRDKVDLAEELATFDEPFAPRIVGHYNGKKLRSRRPTASSSGTRTPTRTTCSSCWRGS